MNKFAVTFFDHWSARFKREEEVTLAELREMIETQTSESKGALPWVKLALFGTVTTDKGCLRHNENVEGVTGVEADYDAEMIPFDEARDKLKKASVAALIYTSASHTADRPRYRILCPFSEKLAPGERAQMVARLNGLFGGALAPESFTLSQAFYYGHILDADRNVVAHRKNGDGRIDVVRGECRVELIEGQPIDQCDELDRGAIGKSGKSGGNGGGEYHSGGDYIEIQELIRRITSGQSLHPSVGSIAGKYARAGHPLETCVDLVGAAFALAGQGRYAGRWDECVTYIHDIYRKEAKRGGGPAEPSPNPQPHPAEPGPARPELAPAAFHGLAGKVVKQIIPHTESSEAALLLQYLGYFGNAVGRGPYYLVEMTRHFANLFIVLVGLTAKSRKGTSGDRIRAIFNIADPTWTRERILGGMSSGEGLIYAVRDPVYAMRKGVEELIDKGIADKRLLLDEREFFQALTVLKREGNTLSRVVRDAWDCREWIGSLTKNSPTHATKPYISTVAHITVDELRQALDHTSMANGYANRYVFGLVHRGKLLPHGSEQDGEITNLLGMRTLDALKAARVAGRVTMTEAAARRWSIIYEELSEGAPGLLGAITARAEPQTLRFALVYALLDQASQIDVVHLDAALAVWRFCEASARIIFGDTLGDPTADAILRALRSAGTNGMTRTDLLNLFGRNLPANKLDAALTRLASSGNARCETRARATGGRPTETWFAVRKS